MKIEGKIAVVVGSARGMGKAICEALLAKGASVVAADIMEERGRATVTEFQSKFGEGKSIFVKCDNTNDKDIEDLFSLTRSKFGSPDIVVHVAAVIDEFKWERSVDVNLGGVIRTTDNALKYMSKENQGKGGVIVHMGSISSLAPAHFGPVYTATKYAILGYALSWALPENYERTRVRFNTVCPTCTATEFLQQVNPEKALNSHRLQEYILHGPKLSPSFVAEGVIKVVEDDSANGKAMRVSLERGHDYATFEVQPSQ